MTVQEEVYKCVVDRGYREGYSAEQFAARQLAKAVEEIHELSINFNSGLYVTWKRLLAITAELSKEAFDNDEWTQWQLHPLLYDLAWQELADLQVVVFCLAEALNELSNQSNDLTVARNDLT